MTFDDLKIITNEHKKSETRETIIIEFIYGSYLIKCKKSSLFDSITVKGECISGFGPSLELELSEYVLYPSAQISRLTTDMIDDYIKNVSEAKDICLFLKSNLNQLLKG